MIGFLCVDKPHGMTSRGVVNRIARHVKPLRVGHAGTLDPLATGVLVVAVGRATKLISHVQRMQKQYSAGFELGKTSDTEDSTGNITIVEGAVAPASGELERACEKFTGRIMQRPPAYSALRVNGRRAYDLARKGEPVELQERPVDIYQIDILDYHYPALNLGVTCGSGTYIRSLGRDVGEQLGCGALMNRLQRTAVGVFRIQDAVTIEELEDADAIRAHLLPLNMGLAGLPRFEVTAEQRRLLSFGNRLELEVEADEVAAYSPTEEPLAVLLRESGNKFRASVSFIAV